MMEAAVYMKRWYNSTSLDGIAYHKTESYTEIEQDKIEWRTSVNSLVNIGIFRSKYEVLMGILNHGFSARCCHQKNKQNVFYQNLLPLASR
jgi:hypothetical protein